MTVKIYGNGWETLIDEEDFEYLSQFKWHLSNKGYVVRKPGKKTIFMHRLINKTPDSMQTDHINRDKLDNRRCNLRSVTNQQNHFNMPLQKNNKSGYKGVCWDKSRSKWLAKIEVNGKQIALGRYLSKEDAIQIRENAVKVYHNV